MKGRAVRKPMMAASKWSEGSDKRTSLPLHQNGVTWFSAFVKSN